jgi:hypothetical protein
VHQENLLQSYLEKERNTCAKDRKMKKKGWTRKKSGREHPRVLSLKSRLPLHQSSAHALLLNTQEELRIIDKERKQQERNKKKKKPKKNKKAVEAKNNWISLRKKHENRRTGTFLTGRAGSCAPRQNEENNQTFLRTLLD